MFYLILNSFSCHSAFRLRWQLYQNFRASTSPYSSSPLAQHCFSSLNTYLTLLLPSANFSAQLRVPPKAFFIFSAIYLSKYAINSPYFYSIIMARLSLISCSALFFTEFDFKSSCRFFIFYMMAFSIFFTVLAMQLRYHRCMVTILSLQRLQNVIFFCSFILEYFRLFFYYSSCLMVVMKLLFFGLLIQF